MKRLDHSLFAELTRTAQDSPRLRSHHNLHESLDHPIHRLVMAVEPGTYVRPHRHPGADRWEMLIVLKGEVSLLTFDEAGVVLGRIDLGPNQPTVAVEIPGGTIHALVSMEPSTIVMEVKAGPYRKPADGDWAAWAPLEGEPACTAVETWYHHAAPGDHFIARFSSDDR
jgi:cupin fold WbuC family metalloprotein